MRALEHAFGVRLDALAVVAARLAGRTSAAQLMQSLREAFGIDLRDAKHAIVALDDGRDDAIDAELAIAIANRDR